MLASQVELKRFVLLSTANVPAAAGTVINLSNGIVQGDDGNNRSGNLINVKRQILRVRFSAVAASQTVRFIFFKDNNNRGTTPAVLELLQSASLMSQFNTTVSLQHRFSILHDISISGNLNGESIKERVINNKRTYPIYYDASTAVAAANGPGATFVLVIGETASGLYDIAYEVHYGDA